MSLFGLCDSLQLKLQMHDFEREGVISLLLNDVCHSFCEGLKATLRLFFERISTVFSVIFWGCDDDFIFCFYVNVDLIKCYTFIFYVYRFRQSF